MTTELKGRWMVQYYLKFDTDTSFMQVTEDIKFDPEVNRKEYSPEYKSREVQPTFSVGKEVSYDMEIDVMLPSSFQAKLLSCEDTPNVPVEIVRAITFDPASGDALADTAYDAYMESGFMNLDRIDGDASGSIRVTGDIKVSSVRTHGTFNAKTNTFTADTPAGG